MDDANTEASPTRRNVPPSPTHRLNLQDPRNLEGYVVGITNSNQDDRHNRLLLPVTRPTARNSWLPFNTARASPYQIESDHSDLRLLTSVWVPVGLFIACLAFSGLAFSLFTIIGIEDLDGKRKGLVGIWSGFAVLIGLWVACKIWVCLRVGRGDVSGEDGGLNGSHGFELLDWVGPFRSFNTAQLRRYQEEVEEWEHPRQSIDSNRATCGTTPILSPEPSIREENSAITGCSRRDAVTQETSPFPLPGAIAKHLTKSPPEDLPVREKYVSVSQEENIEKEDNDQPENSTETNQLSTNEAKIDMNHKAPFFNPTFAPRKRASSISPSEPSPRSLPAPREVVVPHNETQQLPEKHSPSPPNVEFVTGPGKISVIEAADDESSEVHSLAGHDLLFQNNGDGQGNANAPSSAFPGGSGNGGETSFRRRSMR